VAANLKTVKHISRASEAVSAGLEKTEGALEKDEKVEGREGKTMKWFN
jgi:hypothetical protein